MKNRKRITGITLIALIITIVIMLILLTVGIDIAIDGKLIETASESVDKHNNRVAKEQDKIDELVYEWNNLEGELSTSGGEEENISENIAVDNTTGGTEEEPTECTHTYGEWKVTKEATCAETGLQIRTCTICGKTETGLIEKTGTHSGNWTVTKEATCVETGIQTRTCTACGTTETQTITALGHNALTYAYLVNNQMRHCHMCNRCRRRQD